MTIVKKIKTLLAARKTLYKEADIDAAAEILSRATNTRPDWDPKKTYKKSSNAAKHTRNAVVATGGPLAALFLLLRTLSPDTIPWDTEKDPIVVAALTTLLAPIFSMWRKWLEDKKAHI